MNTYVIRRAILGAFYSYQNPQEIRMILFNQDLCLAFNRLVIEKDNAITVRQEIDFLSEKGYLEPILGFDSWYKLKGEIRLKLDAALGKIERSELRSDPFLFGPEAMR